MGSNQSYNYGNNKQYTCLSNNKKGADNELSDKSRLQPSQTKSRPKNNA